MQVDFYQLSRDPAEAALALIARNTLKAGQRLLVVSADDALAGRIRDALWAMPGTFLAHGLAGSGHDDRQPILLSDRAEASNGARFIALADGQWREEALEFDRAFLLFDDATVAAARTTWSGLKGTADLIRNYWRQDGGKWVKAA